MALYEKDRVDTVGSMRKLAGPCTGPEMPESAPPGWLGPDSPAPDFYGSESEKAASLEEIFKYHAPTQDQVLKYAAVRAAGLALAHAITSACPRCADRTAAIRKVREAVMTANSAIALRGAV